QFWRICDANNVLDPSELTENPGRRVRITLPEGFPGVKNG
ncbi:MAG: LysM domain-containing protein, partial [candidate division WOR-3 bacterium]